MMDPNNLMKLDSHKRLTVLSVRLDLVRRLWPEEKEVRELVVEAVSILEEFRECDPRRKTAENFLTNVFSLLRRPNELIDLCLAFPKPESALYLMDQFVFCAVADGDLIAALVSTWDTFSRLPREGSWVGHAMVRRALILSQDHPGRRFEIEELLPLGVEVDRITSRAILGGALDDGALSEAALARLASLFPNDSYFERALTNRSRSDGESARGGAAEK
jgi:hypothetical protein